MDAYRLQCVNGHWVEIDSAQVGERVLCPVCQTFVYLNYSSTGELSEPKFEFRCPDGHQLRVKSKYVGREVRCPSCQKLTPIKAKNALGLESLPPVMAVVEEEAPVVEEVPAQVLDAFGDEEGPPSYETKVKPEAKKPKPSPLKRRPAKDEDEDSDEYEDDEDEDEEDETPAQKAKRKERAKKYKKRGMRNKMGLVRTGLLLMRTALIVSALVAVLIILMSVLTWIGAMMGGAIAMGKIFIAVISIAGIVALLALIAGLVGLGLQLFVPSSSKCLVWIISCFISILVCPVIVILLWYSIPGMLGVFNMFGGAKGGGAIVDTIIAIVIVIISALIMFTPFALFMLYLRQLGYFLRADHLANEAMNILFLTIALSIGSLVFQVMMMILLQVIGQAVLGILGLIVGLIMLVCSIVLLLKMITLLGDLANEVSRRYL